MRHLRVLAWFFGLAVATVGFASPASAQATRTWVSGVGDDANPCSRTAPCKTFAGAISKTAPGGEINCLDPGGFGAVTITKSISIICDHTMGGILAAGTNGVIINAGAGDVIVLSGLDIEGVGTGLNGIRFLAGGTLHVRNTIISGFNATSAGNGNGILFRPNSGSELTVTNTSIIDTGGNLIGAGIEIAPTSTGAAFVNIRSSQFYNNRNFGIRLNVTGVAAGAGISAVLEDVDIAGNSQGLVLLSPPATTTATAMIVHSSVSNNGPFGIRADGANADVRVGNTTISGNAAGVSAVNSGSILTYGNNRLNGNGSDGAFTGPVNEQ